MSTENVKIAVFFRASRAALGWTQVEMAKKLEISKTTLARIETLEMIPKGNIVAHALKIFKEAGVVAEPFLEDFISIKIGEEALEEARKRFEDESLRRTDRRKS